MVTAASAAFGPSSPGFVIVILVMLGVGSWLAEMITSAVGKGQISSFIKTATTIAAILCVIKVAWQLLEKFFNFTVGTM